jgi:hypothetical protein
MTRRTRVGLAPTALGLVVVLAYLNFATNALSLPERLTVIFYSLIRSGSFWSLSR